MSIAAHVGVKDEIELLPHCLTHLLAIGVDRLLVTDMGSTDGSWEWLQEAASGLPLSLDRMDDRAPGVLADWPARVGRRARDCGADWVFFLDADEWPLPRDGSLAGCTSLASADLLVVDRFNVPPGESAMHVLANARPDGYRDVALIVHRIADLRQHLRDSPEAPWILSVPGPKALVRPAFIDKLAIGGHDVEPPPGVVPRRQRPADLVIAHLPFTTRERFRRKVDNVAAAVAANESVFSGRVGWHWRRWLAMREQGLLDAEFDRQRLEAGLPPNSLLSVADWFEAAAAGRRP